MWWLGLLIYFNINVVITLFIWGHTQDVKWSRWDVINFLLLGLPIVIVYIWRERYK